MTKRKLTPEEKDTLRVMKMQERDLGLLEKDTDSHHEQLNEMSQQLEKLKESAKRLAITEGITIPQEHHYPTTRQNKTVIIDSKRVPSWSSLKQRAEAENIPTDISIEDLLNENEIAKAQEDTKNIEEEFTQLTGLSKRDIKFLLLATYLQATRWTATGKAIPIKRVPTGTTLPTKINIKIEQLHASLYDPEKDGLRAFYEARTRKILMISNLLASTLNVAFAASTELWNKIDTEGLLTTLNRVAQDGSYLINLRDAFEKIKMDKVLEKELQDIENHFKHLPTLND